MTGAGTAGPGSAVRPQTRLSPEARREQIVREATSLIAQSGFNAVSLAAIAEACGIRKPSVLHYFPSMNDILAAVLVKRDFDAYAENDGIEGLRGRDNVRASLRRVIERNLENREMIRLYVLVAAEALDPGHPAHTYFVDRNRLAVKQIEQMLDWTADPSLAAQGLLAFWQGLEVLWVHNPSIDFLDVWDRFSDSFFA